jgi:hypothetical protein
MQSSRARHPLQRDKPPNKNSGIKIPACMPLLALSNANTNSALVDSPAFDRLPRHPVSINYPLHFRKRSVRFRSLHLQSGDHVQTPSYPAALEIKGREIVVHFDSGRLHPHNHKIGLGCDGLFAGQSHQRLDAYAVDSFRQRRAVAGGHQ